MLLYHEVVMSVFSRIIFRVLIKLYPPQLRYMIRMIINIWESK